VIEEPQSATLASYLAGRSEQVSSALARVEVVRAVRPHGESSVERASLLVDGLRLVAVDERVLRAAATIGDAKLRSLDAVHLASAEALEDDLEAIVTYDDRLARAAVALGLPVVSPV
jgi:predicted nucleic acid-binding protein